MVTNRFNSDFDNNEAMLRYHADKSFLSYLTLVERAYDNEAKATLPENSEFAMLKFHAIRAFRRGNAYLDQVISYAR